ncbi:hypothetical protein BC827DRAFT_85411 [Russula dissimulans]|nr:hypothetical protein BC827DRAFT_85411 [Russula dissimulans]
MRNRPDQTSTSTYNLNDDTLLEIFRLYLVDCRRVVTDEDDHESTLAVLNPGEWGHKGWWRQLTQVCRRWRHLALGSAQHLLTLVVIPARRLQKCWHVLPPFLPLIIDNRGRAMGNTNYEEGITLALQRRDHVRCIRLGSLIQIM